MPLEPVVQVHHVSSAQRTIFKFQFQIYDTIPIEMPAGARILSCQMQFGIPSIWAIVDPNAADRTRIIYLRGTGDALGSAEVCPFIGTIQQGPLVWHLFDGGEQ